MCGLSQHSSSLLAQQKPFTLRSWIDGRIFSRFLHLPIFSPASAERTQWRCCFRLWRLPSYKLLDDKNPRKKLSAFAGVALTSTALCYTEYVGCILIPLLGLCALTICGRNYLNTQDKTAKRAALNKFFRSVGALFVGFLLFSPGYHQCFCKWTARHIPTSLH